MFLFVSILGQSMPALVGHRLSRSASSCLAGVRPSAFSHLLTNAPGTPHGVVIVAHVVPGSLAC